MKMHKILSRTFFSAMALSLSLTSFAGNEDRIGSAGATELLINPWTRSAAFGDAGVACGIGLSSVYTNIAGLAFTEKTEILIFWLL